MMINWKKRQNLFMAAIAFLLMAGTSCERPNLAKEWVFPDAELHQLSRLEIHYNCGKKPIRHYDPLTHALWLVKAHMRCPRIECSWGRAQGVSDKDGSLRAKYSTFSAIRQLIIKDQGSLLEVDVVIEYRDQRPTSRYKVYLQPAE